MRFDRLAWNNASRLERNERKAQCVENATTREWVIKSVGRALKESSYSKLLDFLTRRWKIENRLARFLNRYFRNCGINI